MTNYQDIKIYVFLSRIKKVVVLMDRTRYPEKYFEMLATNQFIKLNHDPTKSVKGKIQRLLRMFKSKLSRIEYYQFHPTGLVLGNSTEQPKSTNCHPMAT